MTHPIILEITQRIRDRSNQTRSDYLRQCELGRARPTARATLGCTNLAHAYAAARPDEKILLRHTEKTPNLGIVTAYNDMLSAHHPYGHYPEQIKQAALRNGATAQVAGGVPAMCDGVTQGQPGMELSLFSRDTIALATAVALSHHVFDGALYLGICDKIVPGLLIGALSFGFLPGLFVPSGPMPSGLSNEEKGRVRVAHAEGRVSNEELLRSEEASYHSAGTCTFYGTANSNQMLLEMMGLQLPGSAFVTPDTPLRRALTEASVARLAERCKSGSKGLGEMLDATHMVNAVIGLLATGGSTNHTLHLIAIGRAAGWLLDWQDFSDLSDVIPLLARLYPNGSADVNDFHHQGGTPAVLQTLAEHGLAYAEIETAHGMPLTDAALYPAWQQERLRWEPSPPLRADSTILRPASAPFSKTGGLRLLEGSLGRGIIKISSLPEGLPPFVEAPARVFHDQDRFLQAYRNGELAHDFVAVLPGQGPAANGMPELHKLSPALTSLQNHGHHVALLTDGRMSGASGKFPAALHITPEAMHGGLIGRIRDGDLIRIDWAHNRLDLLVDPHTLSQREPYTLPSQSHTLGRQLFRHARAQVSPADQGASFIL